MTEEEADSVIPYRITVTNTGNVPYMFDVILSDTTSSIENTIDYQYIMTKVGYLDTKSLSDCTNNIIKEDVILPAGESVDIDIRIWLDSTLSNSEIGKSFYAKLTIDGLAVYNVDTENVDNSLLSLRYMNSSSTSNFRSDTYLTSIKSVSFVDYIDTSNASIVDSSTETASLMDMSFNIMPIENTTEIISWDMSTKGNGSVVAWLEDNEEDGYYDLYIGSTEKIYINSLNNFFLEMRTLESISFDNLDTSLTNDMYRMFYGCNSLIELDLSNFNTSNVTNMGQMFRNCASLVSLDVSSFDTSNISNMQYMFADCNNLTELDLSGFDTSKVMGMGNMFSDCSSLTSLNLDSFDTSNVTNMGQMFCSSGLTMLDLSNFDTSKVTNMSGMFYGCNDLIKLDVSNFDTSNVTTMSSMFGHCISLVELEIGAFNTGKVINMYNMFYYTNLAELDLSRWDTSNVTTMEGMFRQSRNLTTTLTIRNSTTAYENMFYRAAISEDSQIILNYTSDTSDLVDSMIATGTGNIVKGTLVE